MIFLDELVEGGIFKYTGIERPASDRSYNYPNTTSGNDSSRVALYIKLD